MAPTFSDKHHKAALHAFRWQLRHHQATGQQKGKGPGKLFANTFLKWWLMDPGHKELWKMLNKWAGHNGPTPPTPRAGAKSGKSKGGWDEWIARGVLAGKIAKKAGILPEELEGILATIESLLPEIFCFL